jgi:hypothetical protein
VTSRTLAHATAAPERSTSSFLEPKVTDVGSPRFAERIRLVGAALALAVAACAIGVGLFFALSNDQASTTSTAIRAGVGRYLRQPAVVYPICVSRTNPTYAKAGVYSIPVNYTSPLQVVLHRLDSVWRVVAWRMYDPLGWLAVPGYRYPKTVIRESWCRPVPHTPTAIRAALAKKLTVISKFGMTRPYVPETGQPLYKPNGLGFSVDGGAIYQISRWLSYGKQSAKARATWDYNSCRPSCAASEHRTRVTFLITLTDPKPCRDVVAYTTFAVSQSSNTKLFPNTSWSLERFCS